MAAPVDALPAATVFSALVVTVSATAVRLRAALGSKAGPMPRASKDAAMHLASKDVAMHLASKGVAPLPASRGVTSLPVVISLPVAMCVSKAGRMRAGTAMHVPPPLAAASSRAATRLVVQGNRNRDVVAGAMPTARRPARPHRSAVLAIRAKKR